jgi:hypothetical protein
LAEFARAIVKSALLLVSKTQDLKMSILDLG